MNKHICISFLFLSLSLSHVAFGEKKVTVAVAANMQFAMEKIKTEFEKESGIKVEAIVGSSGKLTAQIMENAPFDVFVSADVNYPDEIYKKGFASGHPAIYAYGSLVLWTNKKDLQLKKDLQFLTSKDVKKIAIANPKTAPYGVATEQLLHYYQLYDKVKDKLVYGENIGQTQQFVASQAADLGFIAKSLVLTDAMKDKGNWIDLDKKAYSPIAQSAVELQYGVKANKENSDLFFKFLFSPKAKEILAKFGYIVYPNE